MIGSLWILIKDEPGMPFLCLFPVALPGLLIDLVANEFQSGKLKGPIDARTQIHTIAGCINDIRFFTKFTPLL